MLVSQYLNYTNTQVDPFNQGNNKLDFLKSKLIIYEVYIYV